MKGLAPESFLSRNKKLEQAWVKGKFYLNQACFLIVNEKHMRKCPAIMYG